MNVNGIFVECEDETNWFIPFAGADAGRRWLENVRKEPGVNRACFMETPPVGYSGDGDKPSRYFDGFIGEQILTLGVIK